MKLIICAAFTLAGLAPSAASAQQCDGRWFFATKSACQAKNRRCAKSKNRPQCWSAVESFPVSGRTTKAAPKIWKAPPNAKVYVERIDGTVCLDPVGAVCGGPEGVTVAACNQPTDECVCPRVCPSARFGALMRDNCVPVRPGSFDGGSGRHVYFINQDCHPRNNQGAFRLKVSY